MSFDGDRIHRAGVLGGRQQGEKREKKETHPHEPQEKVTNNTIVLLGACVDHLKQEFDLLSPPAPASGPTHPSLFSCTLCRTTGFGSDVGLFPLVSILTKLSVP